MNYENNSREFPIEVFAILVVGKNCTESFTSRALLIHMTNIAIRSMVLQNQLITSIQTTIY